jgi:histidyl-tRNA synthetase
MGFGDVVVGEVLREVLGDAAPVQRKGYCIGYMTEAERPGAIALAARLRAANERVDLALLAQKPKHFFGKAGNSAAQFAIFLGPDDVATGIAQVKDLQTREAKQIQL